MLGALSSEPPNGSNLLIFGIWRSRRRQQRQPALSALLAFAASRSRTTGTIASQASYGFASPFISRWRTTIWRGSNYDRAEAARIFFTTSSRSGIDQSESSLRYWACGGRCGASHGRSGRMREAGHSRARSSAVILASTAGAAVLLGAIAACTAAIAGGRYRDGREAIPIFWDWGRTHEIRRAQPSMPR